jgi:hypothetical protein
MRIARTSCGRAGHVSRLTHRYGFAVNFDLASLLLPSEVERRASESREHLVGVATATIAASHSRHSIRLVAAVAT